MHTVKVIAGGLLLLAVCLVVGRLLNPATATGLAKGAKVFIPLWLLGAAINMWLGVTKAGYTVAEEAPTFLGVFALPAAVALLIVWWLSRA
jgi:hypothetical protein